MSERPDRVEYAYTETRTPQSSTPNQLNKHLLIQPMNQAPPWADYTFLKEHLNDFGSGGGVPYIGNSYGTLRGISIPSFALFKAAFPPCSLWPSGQIAIIALSSTMAV